MAELEATQLKIGDMAPPFTGLPGTDGRPHSLQEFASSPLLLVVFSCNHCPYAQAWEGRLLQLAKDYAMKGMATVIINPNDTANYPDDRMDRMKERARAKNYPCPYVRDDSQEVAHAYGALVTPHLYLFDRQRRLIFQGRVDDNWQEPAKAKKHFAQEAIEAALQGKPVPTPTTSVIGCTVKWL